MPHLLNRIFPLPQTGVSPINVCEAQAHFFSYLTKAQTQ